MSIALPCLLSSQHGWLQSLFMAAARFMFLPSNRLLEELVQTVSKRGKIGWAQLGTFLPSSLSPPSPAHHIKARSMRSTLHTIQPSPTSSAMWVSYSWQKQVHHYHVTCMFSWQAWRLPIGAGPASDASGGRVATANIWPCHKPWHCGGKHISLNVAIC